jgi:hypothetical protein
MPFEIAVYIHVNDPGLPIWQVVPLSILGCAIAFGLIWGVVALASLPGERRLRRRVRAVEAAAGQPPPYGVPAVEAAAGRLFREVHSAWDAGDRERLSRVSASGLMADWITRLDVYAAADKRQRVHVLDRPRLDYVSLLADRGRCFSLRRLTPARQWRGLHRQHRDGGEGWEKYSCTSS